MSVATEFAPEVYIPVKARPVRERHLRVIVDAVPTPVPAVPRVVGRTAVRPTIQVIQPGSSTAPLRLTRRGLLVLVGLVAAIATVLVCFAWASAPAASGRSAVAVPANVTVMPGDTLWSIASRIAPSRDPQAEIEQLKRLNGLSGVALVPGQLLRTR